MGQQTEFQYVCAECGETIAVNAAMRDALIEHGCIICGAAVSETAFE
jgi:DNA-directed RNA polymerase subunit RPC12/RpoP